MTAHNPKWFKTGDDAKAALAFENYKATGELSQYVLAADPEYAELPWWRGFGLVIAPKHVSPTGAAILPKNTYPFSKSNFVKGWKEILAEINWNKHGVVSRHLIFVILWHHKSTDGRFNDKLGRFERWGAYPLSSWAFFPMGSMIYDPAKGGVVGKSVICDKSFARIKDRLVAMGLIVAESHLWNGHTRLWIKPTEELLRIMFEEGYWSTVRAKYAYVPVKRKPRGVHAAKAKSALPSCKNVLSEKPMPGMCGVT
jgi:hypothetical protein